MGKKRRQFESWADAEAAYNASSKLAGALQLALTDLVSGSVKWIEGEQPRKIGLSRLAAAHGGIVILVERHGIGAMYLEDWLSSEQSRPAPLTTKEYMPEYRAWLDVRRLAAAAKTAQAEAIKKADEEGKGCQRTGIPPEVDQKVRKY